MQKPTPANTVSTTGSPDEPQDGDLRKLTDVETKALRRAFRPGMSSPLNQEFDLHDGPLSAVALGGSNHGDARVGRGHIRPAARPSSRSAMIDLPNWKSAPENVADAASPDRFRWDPGAAPEDTLSWMTGMRTVTTAGDVNTHVGMASHVYLVTCSMVDDYFYSADSELVVVPQEGRLRFCTEAGIIAPDLEEVTVLPRGLIYRVEVIDGPCRGFVCENYGQDLDLPDCGLTDAGADPIADRGGLAPAIAAIAAYDPPSTLTIKSGGQFHRFQLPQPPLEAAA